MSATRRPHVEQQKWMPFINRSGVSVPPYAVIQLTGAESYQDGPNRYDVLTGEQGSSGVSANNIAINDGQQVPSGEVGRCTRSSPFVVAFSGTLNTDDTCGPKAGQFGVDSTGTGLIFHGALAGDPTKALVSFASGEAVKWSVAAKVRTGGIAAFNTSNNRPGSATVDLWAVNEGVSPAVMVDLETFAIAYNVSTTAIPASAFVPLVREPTSGVWIAVFGGSGSQAIIVKTSVGASIPARVGTDLLGSSQSCEVFTIEDDELVTTGEFETIINVESRPVPADEFFTAITDKNSGQWIAVVPLGFDRCAAKAKGAFTTATATITVDNVTVEKGRSPLTDPDDLTEELLVQNRYSYDGVDNADMTIAWREDNEEWYLLQKGC